MAAFIPPRNLEDSFGELNEPHVVSSTRSFWENLGHKKQLHGNPDPQQRDGQQKEQPLGQVLQHGEKEKEVEKEKEKESAKQKAHRFLSMLVLVAIVTLVWCFISEPPVLVWRFSLLLCCCSVIGSRLLDVTVSAYIMCLVIFSGFMTALYLNAVVDAEIGVLIAHLNSHLAVGMLGYALAMHCQHNGLEVTPTTAARRKLSEKKAISEEKAKEIFRVQILGWFCFGMFTIGIAVRMAWVVCYRADYPTEYLVLHAFGPMAFALLLWSIFLGALLLKDMFIGETRLTSVVAHMVLVEILFLFSYVVLGDVGAMIVTWLGILVWTGFSGYCLCVYVSFKHEDPETRAAAKQD